MAKYKLEYIWLDGYEPVANLRGKTQVKEFKDFPELDELPMWGFDGSSTRQAEGKTSDCMLKPVAVFPDSTKKNGVLVMCEVMMPDMTTNITALLVISHFNHLPPHDYFRVSMNRYRCVNGGLLTEAESLIGSIS